MANGLALTKAEAGAILLRAQGLQRVGHERPCPATPDDVVRTIRAMHVLQIDTIHVVARSPYIVLWSRLGDYRPEWLDQALADGKLFEYWSHEASFLPVEDWPLYRRRMLDSHRRTDRAWRWLSENVGAVEHVLALVDERGEVKSADFARENPGSSQGWWDWKPEKIALEYLFMVGDLVVARRERFQRVYTRRQTRFPEWDDALTPAAEEVAVAQVRAAIKALGLGTVGWIADYFRRPRQETRDALLHLLDRGEVIEVELDGVPGPVYADPDALQCLAGDDSAPVGTTLLSPFDPVVWDRDRALRLFGFDYRIECYTPAAKRKYGYFTLPILHHGRLVGRLDPKAHRKEHRLEVKSLHLEPGVEPTDDLLAGLARALRAFAGWQQLDAVTIASAPTERIAGALTERLA